LSYGGVDSSVRAAAEAAGRHGGEPNVRTVPPGACFGPPTRISAPRKATARPNWAALVPTAGIASRS